MTTANAVVGLKDETLSKLRELRRLNVDSAKGFEECAAIVKNPTLKDAFTGIARDRREQAEVLATQIEWNDGPEEEDGSYLAAAHRAWLSVRDACTSDSMGTALEEAERGEDVIKDAYEEALKDVVGTPAHDLIAQQHESVKRIHDKVRDLRDQHRAGS
ncbi:PA2169 family four-helix-bundle protein [Pseudobythopirellula maris]|uniref:PA2169 family four-helix-bundle protein n=1 Tax=Pseudobythopirellula maris TaxID=2527991 RepID=UPI0011B643D0|nr:PA2169 family four-helix-bundle protein [Pseudobythopirellula maris]